VQVPPFQAPPRHGEEEANDELVALPFAARTLGAGLCLAPALAQTAEQRLAPMRERVERLEDQDAIELLQADYGYYFDKGMWSEVASCSPATAGSNTASAGSTSARSGSGGRCCCSGPNGSARPSQQPHAVAGGDHRGAGRTHGDRALPGHGHAGRAGANGVWGVGIYENEYVKEGGVWKISSLHFYPTGMTDYDAGWMRGACRWKGRARCSRRTEPPTVVYRTFPQLHPAEFSYPHPVTGNRSRSAAAAPTIVAGGNDDEAATVLPACRAAALLRRRPPPHRSAAPTLLDQLDARITRLEDMNAIERLQRTYGYFVDKGQWTQLSELFTEDATLEIGGKGMFLGRHRVLEYMQTAFGPMART
jgi:hypothetical protein